MRSKNLDDCAALENWLITKSDDNGLDYLSNITAYIAELEAKLDAVETEVNNIDEASSHRYTTQGRFWIIQNAANIRRYRNIRSIVQALRKALEQGDE